MTFWHRKRAFLAIFEVKNGLNWPLRSTGSTRENAQKSIFDHFSKCSKNRSKGQKMLKNTSFESYDIVLFENITYKSAKRHAEATALRKCHMALVKWRFFGFFPPTRGKSPKKSIFDYFSKCFKNRSKRQKMLKNTSFESYGIVLFEKNNAQKCQKAHRSYSST